MAKIEEKKQIEPVNYDKLVEDFFRTKKFEKKYIDPLIERITTADLNTYMPELRIELRDLEEKLLDKFRETPNEFIETIKESLLNRLLFDPTVKEIFEREKIIAETFHIIPDPVDFESSIPRVSDLTINKTRFKNRFVILEGRYMNIGIDKKLGFNSIKFRCTSCLSEFDKYYLNNIDERIKSPDCCIRAKCKNKDFEKIDSDSFEIGHFNIDDLDFKKTGNFLSCIILKNIDYFIEKIKTINLGEDVEVLGILRVNYFDLKSRRETQRFEYYLEVYDIQPKQSKTFDQDILDTLEFKLKNDNSYFEKLIDSVHPLTYLIDIYYPIKLLNIISFITGGLWNKRDNIRDTLNTIIMGPKSTYKSSICREFETIIGKRHYIVYEVNKEMTEAGLIGTTQRDANRISPIIRYGILLLYSNGTIVWDEGQKISMKILDIFRCLEKGNTGGLQDALIFIGPTEESMILVQNCVKNRDGSYNYGKDESIFSNLGWDDKNSESRLERFDLFYIIPPPDIFIKLRTLENERKLSMGTLLEEIAADLELGDYNFPKNIETVTGKITYLLYHYFHKAKDFYREISLLETEKDVLRQLYRNALIEKEDRYKTDTDINIRSLNICYKVLKGLSALRFIETVGQTSFNYFRKKCMKFILPFRESELIDTKQIDMNEIFKNTFRTIARNEIIIQEFIDEIRAYMKRTYYNDKPEEVFKEEIKDYIRSEYNLRENYEFNKLLKNNENWLNNQGFFVKKRKGQVTTIKKMNDSERISKSTGRIMRERIDLSYDEKIENDKKIIEKIEEIFEENEFKGLEEKSIKQNLKLEFNIDLIERALNYLWDNEILIPDADNDTLLYFKKEKLLNVRKDGVGGEKKKGDI